jgi:hypothetical protein
MLPRKNTEIQPMSESNVGANLMFALRTKTCIKPIFENELETFASDIGSQTIVVQRANIRFAPTLLSEIGWISITTIYPKIYDSLLIHWMGNKWARKKRRNYLIRIIRHLYFMDNLLCS